MSSTGKWRNSASLILVANAPSTNCKYDYKLLVLKRSERTSLFPNQSVFPGGLFEESDESVEWLKYFEEFGVSQDSLKQLMIVSDNRPAILAPLGNGCYDRFFKCSFIWAREISLRIAALRETFEEAGVLLCRSREQLKANRQNSFVCEDFNKAYWQKAVHDDSRAFLKLCKELKVVPDLWGLFEWSAWGTPPTIPNKKFDTVFFMSFLPSIPNTLAEKSEVMEVMWHSPDYLFEMVEQGSIFFLPPQMYEISRVSSIKYFNKLVDFTEKREPKGITIYIPIQYQCKDGIISILPGDDYYDNDPRKHAKPIPIDFTIDEFRAKTRNLHRTENPSFFSSPVLLNFTLPHGHLPPLPNMDGRHKL